MNEHHDTSLFCQTDILSSSQQHTQRKTVAFSRVLFNMHLGDWDYVHACHTCASVMYLLS